MAGYTLEALEGDIRSYTEVDSNVLTGAILGRFIENAEYRVMRDCPIDADRKAQTGNLVSGQPTINAPAGCLFVRGVQVYTSTSVSTGANSWMEKIELIYRSIFLLKHLQESLNIIQCLEELRALQIRLLDV